MSDNLKDKFSALGEKLKVGGSDMSRKVSERMNSISGKMKELFLVPTPADKIVEEATSEIMDGPDWSRNLDLCDQVNHEKISGQDAVRAIKKRIMIKHPTVQILALTLLETCVKNCDKMFSEVASEKVLDEMVKLIDDRQSSIESREKALKLIEAWGESTEELRYLPVFEETYKSLRSRGVKFPGRDNESLAPIFTPPSIAPSPPIGSNRGTSSPNTAPPFWSEEFAAPNTDPSDPSNVKETFDVARNSTELLATVLSSSPHQEALKDDITTTLVEQCRQSQFNLQRIIQRAGDDDPTLFEALNLNDELQKVLDKYDESSAPAATNTTAAAPVATSAPPSTRVNRPSAPAFTSVPAHEEDDLLTGGGEDALVRNYGQRMQHTPLSTQGDDKAMEDLDEMIFGKKAGASS
ncbi:hypothetical protein MPTK1_1g23050 [Marchantia polymorpha subsp. ruderalis]|nr:hypothetical protein MARPO_0065s0071 [Marchantia polymorpha]BBM99687.1 hypothetical protein Mp_1g23050 [Marchantia polymorpha subsp. ruderalis]|eukprot:PTQ36269.1 hypothetical protein MARPO_0065s0071 [Marchantia polymorpha]